MNVTIQMPDATYNELMANNKRRIEGSLVITAKGEGNFRPWNRQKKLPHPRQTIKLLKSGKVRVTPEECKVIMKIEREVGVEFPFTTMLDDFHEAEDFLETFRGQDWE